MSKAEGVKEVAKFLDQKCKELKKRIDEVGAVWTSLYDRAEATLELKAQLDLAVELKISIEKFAKKLQHEEREAQEKCNNG